MYARDHGLIATPIGTIELVGTAHVIDAIRILPERTAPRAPNGPALLAAAEQLVAWFAGALRTFDLTLARPSTERGAQLRHGLSAVPYASTITYGGLAAKLGSSSRAIGQLCSRNRFPIVVPCHRVLSTGAAPDRYSAGDGPVTKQWLLAFERRHHGD